MTKSKIFMAFASGKESTEGTPTKRYIGIAPVSVIDVNPNKVALEALYNTTLEKDPEYVGYTEVDGKKITHVRLDFIVKTDPEKCNGIEMTSKVSFFLRNEYRFNKLKDKIQVINKYGETAWLTIEEAKSGKVPESIQWFEAGEYRPILMGEEELTKFLKAYLNIPSLSYLNKTTGETVYIKDKADAEARLEKITSYFKGDFSELKKIIAYQPNNKVKVLFGVKTTEENRQYQDVYTQMFLKNNINDYTRITKDLEERKAAGSYPNTEFKISTLEEYGIEKTDFKASESNDSKEESDDLPLDSPWAGK